jgi:hypothetical protein
MNNHFILLHIKDHVKHHMPMEIQVLAWDRHKHVVGLNLLMLSLLLIIGSPTVI